MAGDADSRKRSAESKAADEDAKRRHVDQATPGAESDSDLDMPDVHIAPDLKRMLKGSDSESESSSSSSSSDDEGALAKKKLKEKKKGSGRVVRDISGQAGATSAATLAAATQGQEAGAKSKSDLFADEIEAEKEAEKEQQALVPVAVEKPAPASPSSSSSSSSSSDSDDEASLMPHPMGQTPAYESAAGEPDVPKLSQLEIVQRASLRREDMALLLANLPFDAAEDGVVRSFVRLAVEPPKGSAAGSDAICLLAEVTGMDECVPYEIRRAVGYPLLLRVRLRCKRGGSERNVKVTNVSNGEVTEAELEQWKKLTAKTGVDPDALIEQAELKPADIERARNFKFDEVAIQGMLNKKGDTSSDAQKEARANFLVQTMQTQMDISNIRENEARELEDRYAESLTKLRIQEARSQLMQSQWFEKRPSLFSLKVINKKNYDRQVHDDRHALDYTLMLEQQAAAGGPANLNPFQRRACRPLVAWDTVLTQTDLLPTNKPPEDATKKAEEKPVEKAAAEDDGVAPEERMRRYVRGSLGALPLLRGLGLDM